MWSNLPAPEWLSGSEDRAWQQTLAALQQLWMDVGLAGVGASAPVAWWPPTSGDREILQGQRWLFTSNLSVGNLSQPSQIVVPVMPRDPMQAEEFFCAIAPAFGAIAVRGRHPETGEGGVMFSFEPQVLRRMWAALRLRLQAVRPDAIDLWDAVLEDYPLLPPDYRAISRFSSLLVMSARDRLPLPERHPEQQLFLMPPAIQTSNGTVANSSPETASGRGQSNGRSDKPQDPLTESELLRAIAHEVQTPLTTIRTLTRLLLRRKDLSPIARRHVQSIERECTEQIDRFGLFFRATELNPDKVHLQTTSLVELLERKWPSWQQQVERRGSSLEFDLPEDFPAVVSDPNTLDAMLTGTIDRLSRSAPAGSRIVVRGVTAGEQVKLQFEVDCQGLELEEGDRSPPMQALGQWLVIQPDTGALSLSIPMTRHLFEALGAHFTVRHRPHKGETLTIYLPQHR